MKTILRKIFIYTFALFLIPHIIPGVKIGGGFETLFIGGAILALTFLILKPILTIISFPINILTLGLFSTLSNALILYLMTRIVTDITIKSFSYPEFTFLGFSTPAVNFNIIFAYIFIAFIISILVSAMSWLME